MTTISRPQIEETPGERTAVRRAARPYVHPYAGGMLLGLVLFTTFFLTGNGLGASGGMNLSLIHISEPTRPY